MRLRELKILLENAQKYINVTTKSINNTTHEVKGLQKTINTLNELSVLGLFDHDIKRFKDLGDTVFLSKGDQDIMHLAEPLSKKVIVAVEIVKEKLADFNKALEISLPKEDDHSVSVKLPHYNQIDELSKFFKKLDTAFHTALTIEEVNGSYTVLNFDSGSLWVEILITVQESSIDKLVALKMIGDIIKHSMEFYKQFLDLQVTKATLEKLRIENESIQPSIDALDKQIESILEVKINKIYKSGTYSEESKSSIKKSVKTFSDLIADGTEFYPSIGASGEIVELFPEESRKLNNPQKLLRELPNSDVIKVKSIEE